MFAYRFSIEWHRGDLNTVGIQTAQASSQDQARRMIIHRALKSGWYVSNFVLLNAESLS
jgi:hypothetical protein